MHNFQHLEDLFRQAQGESSLSRLTPGDALTEAVHDYFRHYGLETLLNDTSEVQSEDANNITPPTVGTDLW